MPSPIPGPPPFATSTVAGLVSTVTQQFDGPKEFLGKIQQTGNPLGLASIATGSLPAASSHTGSLVHDSTLNRIRYSNGSVWTTLEIGAGSFVQTTGDTMTGQLTITGAGLLVNSAFNTFYVDASNNRVGVLTASPSVPLDVAGAARIQGLLDLDTALADTKLSVNGHGLGVQANDFRFHLASGAAKFSFRPTAAGASLMELFGTGDLAVDSNTLYVDAVNNRVGILTTTPGFPLQVAGIIHSTVGGVRYPDNVTQTVAFIPSSYVARSGDTMTGGLTVDVADSTFHVDAVGNQVSIGHTAPDRALDIRTGFPDHLVQLQNTDVNGSSGITFHSNGGTERFRVGYANPSFPGVTQGLNFLHTDATTDFIIAHGGVEFHRFGAAGGSVKFDQTDNLLFIDAANNRIGMMQGTPTAGYMLDMNPTLATNGHVVKIRNQSATGYSDIEFFNSANTFHGGIGVGNGTVTDGGNSAFSINVPIGLTIRSGITNHHHFAQNGNVTLDTTDNGFFLDFTNNRSAFGTTTFTGFGGFAHPIVFEMGAGNKTALIRGIGTIRKGLSIADTTNNRTWTWDHTTSANNNRFELWYHNGTSEARILTLTTDGKLGVNNTTPTVELDVVGSGQLSGGLTVDTNTLVVDAAQNSVGIGTTPGAGIKLDVSGVIQGTNVWVPSYGELYENNDPSGTNITITTAGTYYQWVTTTVGTEAGSGYVVGSATTDDLTIGTSGGGKYRVNFSASVTGNANAIVHGAIHKNGTVTHLIFSTKINTNGDQHAVTGSGYLTLASTDTVDLRFTSDTNGDTVTVFHVNLNIEKVAS